jgi:FtsZ-interacting cell division protein ZipA
VRTLMIVLVVVVVAFLIGFFWPGRSRQLQEKVKDEATSARGKSRRRAGKLGDWTATSIDKSRWLTERSAHAGRMAHDKTFRSERGAQEEHELKTKYGEGAERGEGSSEEEPRDKQ